MYKHTLLVLFIALHLAPHALAHVNESHVTQQPPLTEKDRNPQDSDTVLTTLENQQALEPMTKPELNNASQEETIIRKQVFNCNIPKKTCSEMTSCDEAVFYWSECGEKKLDRDNDGIPCESICGRK